MESHCPWSIPLGLLYFLGLWKLLLGSLASHSQSELLSGQLLPNWYWWPSPCSHLGQLSGRRWLWWPPHLLQHSCLLARYWRFHWCWGFYRCCMYLCSCPSSPSFSLFPLPVCDLGSGHTGTKNQPIRNWSSLTEVTWFVLNWWSCIFKILTRVQAVHLHFFLMSEE